MHGFALIIGIIRILAIRDAGNQGKRLCSLSVCSINSVPGPGLRHGCPNTHQFTKSDDTMTAGNMANSQLIE
jgi:hypothetical protein